MIIGEAHSFSVGHSTRPIGEFLALLKEHGIRELVDVRTVPHSKRHPQFDRETLAKAVGAEGIAYTHMPGLGGLRKISYAEHMRSAEFRSALEALMRKTASAPTAFMCSEGSPAKCHRRHIADALVEKGVKVRHILGQSKDAVHVHGERQREFLL